jgi:excisionase family DNA binding protein
MIERRREEAAMMPTVEEDYYTVEEVARRLRVSNMTVYRWIKAGKLGAYKVGGEFRIAEGDIERFLEGSRFRAKEDGNDG